MSASIAPEHRLRSAQHDANAGREAGGAASPFQDGVAVITGAASGLGLALAKQLAARGLRLVLADVEAAPLERAAEEVEALGRPAGAQVRAVQVDVAQADAMQALAVSTQASFGVPSLLFNNAGVSVGGLLWENSPADWEWSLGVNLIGVVHGVRAFVPLMLQAAAQRPGYCGRVVNTASLAGLLCPPNMGAYNVSKHAVLALSETLHHDLGLVAGGKIGVTVACPHFIRTGIGRSLRNRPARLSDTARPTPSQRIHRAMAQRAVSTAALDADAVAARLLSAVAEGRFLMALQPEEAQAVKTRLDSLLNSGSPAPAFPLRPETEDELRRALADSAVAV